MRTTIIIGEHHEHPPAKNFIADNAISFKQCGFKQVFLEGIIPEQIPHLKKNPLDEFNTFESLQHLYSACTSNSLALNFSEDISSRILIDSGLSPDNPALVEVRENQFQHDLNQKNENSIFLTGGGHAENIATALTKAGHNVFVIMAFPQGCETALINFSANLPNEIVLLKSCAQEIKSDLATLLTSKIDNMMSGPASKMKCSPNAAFIDLREQLDSFREKIAAFENLPHKKFNTKLAHLDYMIGSLHMRELNYTKAYEFTFKSLERRRQYNSEDVNSIKNSEMKLITIKTLLEKTKVVNTPAPASNQFTP